MHGSVQHPRRRVSYATRGTDTPPLGRAHAPLRAAVSLLAALQVLGFGLPWVPLALLLAFGVLDRYSASLTPSIWNNLFHVHMFQLCTALAALCGWSDAAQAQSLHSFLLTSMQLQVGLVYGLAGLSKLRVSGLNWFTAPRTLLAAVPFRGTPLGHWLVGSPRRRTAAAAMTAAFELCAPALLLVPGAHPWFAISALAFHLGVLLSMRISFWHLWLFFPPLFLQPWPF
jgi:hypothetical protein